MKTVMYTGYLEQTFGLEKAIDMIAEAGFDGLDYSDGFDESISNCDNYKEKAKQIRELVESKGMKVYQTHAPTITGMLKKYDEEYVMFRMARAIETGALLGAEATIVHPIQDITHKYGDEAIFERNMAHFNELVSYCKEFGGKIAIENMCKTEVKSGVVHDGVCAHPLEFIRYLDSLDKKYVTGCFDTGHCAATGRDPEEVLRILGGERITCLHIHDNDYTKDRHALPYTMNMDWDGICNALSEIGYKGHFSMESCNFIKNFPKEFIPVALKFESDVARHLANKIK